MQEAESELTDLRKRQEHLNKERSALVRVERQHSAATKELNALKWETEALRMRCDKLVEERDELKNKLETAMVEVQQKASLENVLLKRKLNQLRKDYEQLEYEFTEMLKVTGIAPDNLCIKVETYLKEKNERIENLEYELARITKVYNDLLLCYEEGKQPNCPCCKAVC